eukprot:gene33958-43868_t
MNRLCEIYHHAKAYYVMDIRSLLRAWCLFELSSVSVPPILNNTNHDPAMSSLIWRNFYKYGFEGCQFRDGKEEVNHRRGFKHRWSLASRTGFVPDENFNKLLSSSRIDIWEAPTSRRLVRLEYGEDNVLRTAFSANFIFISDKREVSLDPLIELMKRDVGKVGGGEMWIERCPTLEGFCALHFSSKKIEFFDRVLDIAHKLDLKPFPNYIIFGSSNYTRTKRPGTQDLWNSFNDIGLPVDFDSDNPPLISESLTKVLSSMLICRDLTKYARSQCQIVLIQLMGHTLRAS